MSEESTRLIDVPYRELDPMIRKLSQNGFDAELAAELRTDEGAAAAVAALNREFFPAAELFKGLGGIGRMFSPCHSQLLQLQTWQRGEFNWWGFSKEEYQEAERHMPVAFTRPSGSRITPVLVPYLDDWYATIVALWTLIKRQHRDACCDREFSRNRFSLNEPKNYPGYGLRWEFIDLNGTDSSPEYRSSRPAFLALLAAVALHPLWVTDGLVTGQPVCLAGLQYMEKWMFGLVGNGSPTRLRLQIFYADATMKSSVPVLLDYM